MRSYYCIICQVHYSILASSSFTRICQVECDAKNVSKCFFLNILKVTFEAQNHYCWDGRINCLYLKSLNWTNHWLWSGIYGQVCLNIFFTSIQTGNYYEVRLLVWKLRLSWFQFYKGCFLINIDFLEFYCQEIYFLTIITYNKRQKHSSSYISRYTR